MSLSGFTFANALEATGRERQAQSPATSEGTARASQREPVHARLACADLGGPTAPFLTRKPLGDPGPGARGASLCGPLSSQIWGSGDPPVGGWAWDMWSGQSSSSGHCPPCVTERTAWPRPRHASVAQGCCPQCSSLGRNPSCLPGVNAAPLPDSGQVLVLCAQAAQTLPRRPPRSFLVEVGCPAQQRPATPRARQLRAVVPSCTHWTCWPGAGHCSGPGRWQGQGGHKPSSGHLHQCQGRAGQETG